MKFFVILELLLIAARVTVTFFDVPTAANNVLTTACIVIGIIALAFVIARLYREFKGRKE